MTRHSVAPVACDRYGSLLLRRTTVKSSAMVTGYSNAQRLALGRRLRLGHLRLGRLRKKWAYEDLPKTERRKWGGGVSERERERGGRERVREGE